MRSAVLRDGRMHVRDDVDDPRPGPGQVLIEVAACGICGSDLHFVHHGATMLELGSRMEGTPDLGRVPPDLSHDVFMGHEFSGRVVELGPDTSGPAEGTLVTSVPALVTATGLQDLAYTHLYPCGYSDRMLLTAMLAIEVPNGLDAGAPRSPSRWPSASTPSTGRASPRATARSCSGAGRSASPSSPPCRVRGIGPIVASDFSAARRRLAETMGADDVVDPAQTSPFERWAAVGGSRSLVVFEAVGVPGIIDEVLRLAPSLSRVVVVGVCMQPDTITPFYGIGKELNVQFVLGYDPLEFAASLRSIAEGEIDVTPMITGEVGIDEVPDAFARLAHPDEHCKILVVPDT